MNHRNWRRRGRWRGDWLRRGGGNAWRGASSSEKACRDSENQAKVNFRNHHPGMVVIALKYLHARYHGSRDITQIRRIRAVSPIFPRMLWHHPLTSNSFSRARDSGVHTA